MGRQASGRGSWRIALRAARRELLRSKARSALVATMVGVPVLLITGTVILARTWGLSPEEAALRSLGAGVIGFLGAVLGVAGGAIPGIAITWPLTAPSPNGHILDIPWTLLGLLVLVVPTLAVLAAGLFTRSRLPMVRRIA